MMIWWFCHLKGWKRCDVFLYKHSFREGAQRVLRDFRGVLVAFGYVPISLRDFLSWCHPSPCALSRAWPASSSVPQWVMEILLALIQRENPRPRVPHWQNQGSISFKCGETAPVLTRLSVKLPVVSTLVNVHGIRWVHSHVHEACIQPEEF